MQEIAELVVLGGDQANPARGILVLSAVFDVHLEERREPLEKVSEARFVGERRHSPLRTSEENYDATTTTGEGGRNALCATLVQPTAAYITLHRYSSDTGAVRRPSRQEAATKSSFSTSLGEKVCGVRVGTGGKDAPLLGFMPFAALNVGGPQSKTCPLLPRTRSCSRNAVLMARISSALSVPNSSFASSFGIGVLLFDPCPRHGRMMVARRASSIRTYLSENNEIAEQPPTRWGLQRIGQHHRLKTPYILDDTDTVHSPLT